MSSPLSPDEVLIQTGARLHFGPLSYQPESGRHFGGIGMMIAEPGWSLRFTRASSTTAAPVIIGREAGRVEKMLARLQDPFQSAWNVAAVHIEVENAIPAHHGLGSGTQLAIALGRGFTQLAGIDATTTELAAAFGRGQRSAIGTSGYDSGGFLVDAGKRTDLEMGALAVRVAVPDSWRLVLISPSNPGATYSGSSERQAFQKIGKMSEAMSGRLARLVLTEMLPALHAENCPEFSAALYEYGQLVGEFFSPIQGGVYSHPEMRSCADQLDALGISGWVQSSWGPTLALVCDSQAAAKDVTSTIQRDVTVGPLNTRIVAVANGSR
ncbi:MAG: hypothetical protein KDA88_16710 [Planctomycetaceae bacterium]|nr:hypothetical protein [Planctomycetaceae bacterium]